MILIVKSAKTQVNIHNEMYLNKIWGAGGGGLGFFLKNLISSERKSEIFFSQSESQNNFFRTKQKQNIVF